MSVKKRKKKSIFRSRFYQFYFVLVALALVCIAVGTFWLRGMLADYEAAQPVYVAEDVARLFENGDYDRIYALDTAAKALTDGDKALYVESLGELTRGGTIEWSEAFSSNENERKYNVTLDGERFATITLVPNGQTDRRGNRLWTLGSVTTNVKLQEPTPEPTPGPTPEPTPEPKTWHCAITVPEGCQVRANGALLTEQNAEVSAGRLFEDGFLPEGVDNPTLVSYTFASTTVTPEIAVTDANGNPCEVMRVADKALEWECGVVEDQELKAQFGKAAINLGKQVARFISKDSSKKSIQRICAKGSPAEAIFDNLDNTFTTPHSGAEFKNEAATQFYRLSDDCFTCHVSFDYVLYTSKGQREYPTAYTFCVVEKDGEYRLYNMLSF